MTKFVIFESSRTVTDHQPFAVNPDHVVVVHPAGERTRNGWIPTPGEYTLILNTTESPRADIYHDGDLASLIHRLKHGPEQLPPKPAATAAGN